METTEISQAISALSGSISSVNAKIFDYCNENLSSLEGSLSSLKATYYSLSDKVSKVSTSQETISDNLRREAQSRKSMDGQLYEYIMDLSSTGNGYLVSLLTELSGTFIDFRNVAYTVAIKNINTNINTLSGAIDNKQNKLTAGEGITIEENVISVTNGGKYLKRDFSNLSVSSYPSFNTLTSDTTSTWTSESPDAVCEYWVSKDGFSWWRKYQSGWLEQGGLFTFTIDSTFLSRAKSRYGFGLSAMFPHPFSEYVTNIQLSNNPIYSNNKSNTVFTDSSGGKSELTFFNAQDDTSLWTDNPDYYTIDPTTKSPSYPDNVKYNSKDKFIVGIKCQNIDGGSIYNIAWRACGV